MVTHLCTSVRLWRTAIPPLAGRTAGLHVMYSEVHVWSAKVSMDNAPSTAAFTRLSPKLARGSVQVSVQVALP